MRYCLDLREREVGGAVVSGRLYRLAASGVQDFDDRLPEFTHATRGARLLVLLHGYNVTRSEGRLRLTRYMDLLAAHGWHGPMLAVLWPGDGWLKALSYPFEGRDADDAADALWRWLAAHADASARLAFAGHSLGCRVVMEAARRLACSGRPGLDRICLMGAAIDNDSLGRCGRHGYRRATLAAERVAVLASEQDRVLRLAYPLGDLAETLLFGGRWGRALGLTGPNEHDPAILARLAPVPRAAPARGVDHGDYLGAQPGAAHTVAETERFLVPFLDRHPQPRWPAAQ